MDQVDPVKSYQGYVQSNIDEDTYQKQSLNWQQASPANLKNEFARLIPDESM